MSKIETQLAQLDHLRLAGGAAAGELARALASRVGLVVGKAAKIAGELRLVETAGAMKGAFDRLMQADSHTKADPGCVAKTAIARALYDMDAGEEQLYLRGVRHVQPEPGFGGSNDSAVELRVISGNGLLAVGSRRAMVELVDLLADVDPAARAGAARALAGSGRTEARLVLRLKVHLGDAELDVLAECFEGLLRLGGEDEVELVGRFLTLPLRDRRQAAALALGSSRNPAALPILRGRISAGVEEEELSSLLLAIAMLRRPEAIECLLEMIAGEPTRIATAAVEAMRMYRHDTAVADRVRETAAGRKLPVPWA